ncbi:hypothetical protein SK128_021829 [Halocaridina rubra]|uniref:Uncharacterized protein n=1 Tax=Halocaridina rubra TaxID=373956 RepID=A0AAN8X5I3_HALRR
MHPRLFHPIQLSITQLLHYTECRKCCAGIIVGHPFDTLKVRLQMNPNYSGMWNCFKTSVKQESFRGLYKGMSSPIAGISFVNAVVFGVQGGVARRLRDPESLRLRYEIQIFICFSSPVDMAKLSRKMLRDFGFPEVQFAFRDVTISQTIAGATAGFCQAFINSPVELIKIRAQLQTGVVASAEVATSSTLSQTYETPLNLIRNIIATEGMNGLFRGQLITIIREQ